MSSIILINSSSCYRRYLVFSHVTDDGESKEGRKEKGNPESKPLRTQVLEIRKMTMGTKMFPASEVGGKYTRKVSWMPQEDSLSRRPKPFAAHTFTQLSV